MSDQAVGCKAYRSAHSRTSLVRVCKVVRSISHNLVHAQQRVSELVSAQNRFPDLVNFVSAQQRFPIVLSAADSCPCATQSFRFRQCATETLTSSAHIRDFPISSVRNRDLLTPLAHSRDWNKNTRIPRVFVLYVLVRQFKGFSDQVDVASMHT